MPTRGFFYKSQPLEELPPGAKISIISSQDLAEPPGEPEEDIKEFRTFLLSIESSSNETLGFEAEAKANFIVKKPRILRAEPRASPIPVGEGFARE